MDVTGCPLLYLSYNIIESPESEICLIVLNRFPQKIDFKKDKNIPGDQAHRKSLTIDGDLKIL